MIKNWNSLITYECEKVGRIVIIVNGIADGTCDEESCGHECKYNPDLSPVSPVQQSLQKVGKVKINERGGYEIDGRTVSKKTFEAVKREITLDPEYQEHPTQLAKKLDLKTTHSIMTTFAVMKEFEKAGAVLA